MLIACSIMKAGFQCLLGRENEELKLSTNDLMDISHITCNDMLLIFIPVMLFPFLLLNNLMDRKKKWGCIGCVPYLWVGCSFFLFSLQLSYLYHPFITVIGLLRCCICSFLRIVNSCISDFFPTLLRTLKSGVVKRFNVLFILQ